MKLNRICFAKQNSNLLHKRSKIPFLIIIFTHATHQANEYPNAILFNISEIFFVKQVLFDKAH